jgi:hypothetical protein
MCISTYVAVIYKYYLYCIVTFATSIRRKWIRSFIDRYSAAPSTPGLDQICTLKQV